MYKNLFVVMLSICVILTAQSNNSSKERRIYRTQTGAVIKAPSPLFKKGAKKPKEIYSLKSNPKNARLILFLFIQPFMIQQQP